MKTLMVSDVARATGVGAPTLKSWCAMGLVKPVIPGEGTGRHRRFGVVDTLAISICRALRTRGLSLRTVGAALQVLTSFTEEQLLQAFRDGRRYIVLTQDRALGGLMSREEALGQTREQAQEDGLLSIIVDVKVLYDKVCAEIDGLNRTEAATARRLCMS
jgi:DNA-binding transcriptional MerR regulator